MLRKRKSKVSIERDHMLRMKEKEHLRLRGSSEKCRLSMKSLDVNMRSFKMSREPIMLTKKFILIESKSFKRLLSKKNQIEKKWITDTSS